MANADNPLAPEIQEQRLAEEQVTANLSETLLHMNQDDESRLSKVLFPETDTNEVSFCGLKRTIFPVPVKYATRIFNELSPYSKKMAAAMRRNDKDEESMNSDVIEALKRTALILAEFYKWEGVATKINENEVTLSELQALAVKQEEANGHNDFLLGPLRICIRVMQAYEVMQIKFQSTFSMRRSAKNGTAASMS